MLVLTTWKSRQLSVEQSNRMMTIWGKLEAAMAENPNVERLCWYISADASGGVTVSKALDVEAATAFELETCLALGEFLEFDHKVVLDLETAMPAILKGFEYANS
jgi:hypothetical protein